MLRSVTFESFCTSDEGEPRDRCQTVSPQIISAEIVAAYTGGGTCEFSIPKQHILYMVNNGTDEMAGEPSITGSRTNSLERDMPLSVRHSVLRVTREITRQVTRVPRRDCRCFRGEYHGRNRPPGEWDARNFSQSQYYPADHY